MIITMECTDCKFCASFDAGLRVTCMNPSLPASQVYEYEPLGDDDALNCPGFSEGLPTEFTFEELEEAEDVWKNFGTLKYSDALKSYAERKRDA